MDDKVSQFLAAVVSMLQEADYWIDQWDNPGTQPFYREWLVRKTAWQEAYVLAKDILCNDKEDN